jgi:hypothetical protein
MAIKTNADGSKVNVIRLDAKDDEVKRKEAKGMMDLCRLVRESKFNVRRCIMAIHDPDVATFYNVPASESRSYAMVEIFGSNNNSVNDFRLKMKLVEGFLVSHKYKVVASKVFNKEYPIGKIVVSLV